jgi:DNA-binding transcriptional MerR regulator
MTRDPATAPEIPDKLYFKIGEVSDIADIPAYVLRFWESEFKRINPKRTASGQRLYRRSDIDLILKIKDLLYNRKFTIQGARRYLCGRDPLSDTGSKDDDIMSEIRAELLQIKDILER